MPASLKDVARAAGVSPITVSRALSGTHVVAPETRARVLAAVERLRYAPDLLARGLVRRRSSTVGLVVPELANPFFVKLVDAVQTAARERQHLLVVSQSGQDRRVEEESVRQFRQLRVGGILAVPNTRAPGYLAEVEAAGTPVVMVARRPPRHDFVAVDDTAGGRIVAEHLLALGHRRIACVVPDQPENSAIQDRLESFEATLRGGGAPLGREALIETRAVGIDEGFEAAERFLALAVRPTAAFVTADHLAIGFLQGLRRRGLRVPKDVAVVGYDDIVYARYLDVPLTTVELPIPELGRRAVEVLFERFAEGAARRRRPRQILLQPRLLVRASCGATPR